MSRRNWRGTALRLLSPCFFILLALVLDAAVRADENRTLDNERVTTPDRQAIDGIQQCTSNVFIESDGCVHFVYSPNDDAAIEVRGLVAT